MFYGARCENTFGEISACTLDYQCVEGSCTTNGNGEHFCHCNNGYTGRSCDKTKSLCTDNECQHGSMCVEDNEKNIYYCMCRDDNFFGRYCEYTRSTVRVPPQGCPTMPMDLFQIYACTKLLLTTNECSGIGTCIPPSRGGQAYCCCGNTATSINNGLGCEWKGFDP